MSILILLKAPTSSNKRRIEKHCEFLDKIIGAGASAIAYKFHSVTDENRFLRVLFVIAAAGVILQVGEFILQQFN